MSFLFLTPLQKSAWQRIVLLAVCALALGLTFVAYFSPDVMVAFTNTIWALCGF
jgi:hypothetical protein